MAMSKDSAAVRPPWVTASESFRLVTPWASAGTVPSAPPQEGMPTNQGGKTKGKTKGMAKGMMSAVEGQVIEIEVDSKRFNVIEPTAPNLPGGQTNPYPTADIRRCMARPSCSLVNIGGQEMHLLYGYFWNEPKNRVNWNSAEGVGKSEQPPGNNYISLRASPAECLDRSTWWFFG